jgi:preprotein translocase subunit SecF
MLNIIGKRKIYFLISALVILPGIISLFLWGLRLSIDFTGGTRATLLFPQSVSEETAEEVGSIFREEDVEVSSLRQSDSRLIVQTSPLDKEKEERVFERLEEEVGEFRKEEIETIGPVIGSETTLNAFKAIVIASLLIILYIAYSFRAVPKPASSWRFGVCAIIALIHDVLVVVGIFSILGHFFGVEIDSLFVTAILTVIGFSVHDTIVVFDRVRENLRHRIGAPFADVVNDSILQTLVRSLNTSFTAILVLLTLLLFGGESVRWFIFALLIGIISGTYSSIFNAAQFLVVWEEWSRKRSRKQ